MGLGMGLLPAGMPPSILFIMADDMGMGEPGWTYANSSHGRLRTPNIDKLAADGMKFSDAYAGYTVCAPSRSTLFSGRNSGHFKADQPAGWPLLPSLMRDAGYDVAFFGKSAPFDEKPQKEPKGTALQWGLPGAHGVDPFLGQANQAYCHNMYPTYVTRQNETLPLPLNSAPNQKSRQLCMASPASYNYTTDMFADHAIEWLGTRGSAQPRPFFLYLSFTVPHAGGWGSEPNFPENGAPVPTDLGYDPTGAWPTVEKDHAATVTYMDGRVGDTLAALEAAGLARSTAVFFASDNGAHNEGGHDVHFFDSTGGLRGFKRSYYEGGVRTPAVVRWPGVVGAGSSSAHPWAFWDVLPTMLEIAGASPPAAARLDGTSIVPTLRGNAQPPPKYLYWTWTGVKVGEDGDGALAPGAQPEATAPPDAAPGYAVRVGEWKGVVHSCADTQGLAPSAADTMELYNLTADRAETRDVSREHGGVVKMIKQLLAGEGLSCVCYQC